MTGTTKDRYKHGVNLTARELAKLEILERDKERLPKAYAISDERRIYTGNLESDVYWSFPEVHARELFRLDAIVRRRERRNGPKP
jgi:hypothetical protein